jgi:hypothetical protein
MPIQIKGTKRCAKDYECGKNMECLENICYCHQGFLPKEDHCSGSFLLFYLMMMIVVGLVPVLYLEENTENKPSSK